MTRQVEDILIGFFKGEISSWDVLSWANEIESSSVIDPAVLSKLRIIDECVDANEITSNLLALIPNSDEETLSKILLLDNLELLKINKLTPTEFVNFIIRSVWEHESDESGPICSCVYNIFNENNGYGFDNLCAMKNEELAALVQDYINAEETR